MVAFSAKFSTPPSGKTMDGTQKCMGPKWWPGPPPCKIWWKSRVARRSERMKCDVFHFYLFIYLFLFLKITLVGRWPLWCVVDLLPEDIASAFVGRFRWYLHRFLRKKSTFQRIEQLWKFSLGGVTIGARMAEKNENLTKMGAKFVRTTSTI